MSLVRDIRLPALHLGRGEGQRWHRLINPAGRERGYDSVPNLRCALALSCGAGAVGWLAGWLAGWLDEQKGRGQGVEGRPRACMTLCYVKPTSCAERGYEGDLNVVRLENLVGTFG